MNKRMEEIMELAKQEGLDPFPIIFEVVERETMINVCTYGLPTRARHWSYGRSYDHQSTYEKMGMSKVYEVILNNNPAVAFMLDTNSEVQNIFIAAHCTAHSHFFKHNYLFQNTDRNMIRNAAERASRIERYIEEHGFDKVENIMDIGFALDDHIDWNKGLYRKPYDKRKVVYKEVKKGEFDDLLDPQRKSIIKETINEDFPPHPEQDLLWFLINYAPLEEWEKDILGIIREEAFYFYPQKHSKIVNEGWACLCEGSLVFTNLGLIDIKRVVKEDKKLKILNRYGKPKRISNTFTGSKKCLQIETKKGFRLSGANKHGVLAYNKDNNLVWKKLKDLRSGDKILMSYNQNCWGQKLQKLPHVNYTGREKKGVRLPTQIDKNTAKFLGYFLSEGHIGSRSVVLTNGDLNVANDMAKAVENVFGYKCFPRKDGSRYRVKFYSVSAINLLKKIGLGGGARNKSIPEQILLSPKNVIIEFLSAAFCGDGGAYDGGNILALSTGVRKNAEVIQLILLNLGIISSITTNYKEGYEDCFQVWICEKTMKNKFYSMLKTASAQKNEALYSMKYTGKSNFKWSFPLNKNNISIIEMGLFGTTQKEQRENGVNLYHIKKHERITSNQVNKLKFFGINSFLENFFVDEVSKISMPFYSQVFDFTVPEDHEYQAQGFINHNSYWHAELMYKYNLTPEEYLEFCRDHEKVVQPGNPFSINPYYLGFRIFKDIEKRWGKEKILQVAAEESDVSFIRNYLTDELIEELNLFTYGYLDNFKNAEEKLIQLKSRSREDIIEALLFRYYNSGVPNIIVQRANSDGLILRHLNNETLDFKFAEKTLEYIWNLWAGHVELHTKDDKGEDIVLCFDEAGFYIENITEEFEEDEDDEEEENDGFIILKP